MVDFLAYVPVIGLVIILVYGIIFKTLRRTKPEKGLQRSIAAGKTARIFITVIFVVSFSCFLLPIVNSDFFT